MRASYGSLVHASKLRLTEWGIVSETRRFGWQSCLLSHTG